jgi:hypothetical protein
LEVQYDNKNKSKPHIEKKRQLFKTMLIPIKGIFFSVFFSNK